MAIGRGAKGTGHSAGNTPGTGFNAITGVAIGAGSTVVVALTYGNSTGDCSGVKWNGHAMTRRVQQVNTSTSSMLEVWAYENAASGTGAVYVDDTATGGSGFDCYALTCTEVTGAASSSFDKSASDTGYSGAPSSGATATTTQANELILGFIEWETALYSGGWDNGFTAGQHTGDVSTLGLEEGFKIVSGVTTAVASKTAATVANWCAAVATFKELSSGQTSTPARVLVSLSALAAVAVAGAISCTPGRLSTTTSVNAPTSVEGAVMSSPDRVSTTTYALGATGSTPQVSTPGRVLVTTTAQDRAFARSAGNPAIDTVLATLVNGSSTPTVLRSNTAPYGDQSTSTYYGVAGTFGASGGTLTFPVGAMAVTVQGSGVISGVKFYVLARTRRDSHFAIAAGEVTLPVGGGVAFTTAPPAGPWSPVVDFGTLSTSLRTTVDGTNPWTWANLPGALTGLLVTFTFTNSAPFTDLGQVDLAEVWCEVYGPLGTPPVAIPVHSRLGLPGTVSLVPDTFTGGN